MRILVAMATYIFYRLIMGKVQIDIFLFQWGYLEFIFTEMFLSSPLRFICHLSTEITELIGCQGDKKD